MSYQKLIFSGNLGRDPELRYLPSGQAVASFSVAANRQYTASSGERVKETVWFRVSAWGRQAETCNEHLKQGSKVLVEGRLTADKDSGNPRIWAAEDGTPRASYEVSADRVVFLGGGESPSANGHEPAGQMDSVEDEILF